MTITISLINKYYMITLSPTLTYTYLLRPRTELFNLMQKLLTLCYSQLDPKSNVNWLVNHDHHGLWDTWLSSR
ncbi:hypothetical protein BDW74DRAFT_13859 [Aspergillus multicolor]|uniref:uncharacterized protein n=1 Tax=Aspergillus multicolor TaxID=41759 RepID=UPI003CCD2E2E